MKTNKEISSSTPPTPETRKISMTCFLLFSMLIVMVGVGLMVNLTITRFFSQFALDIAQNGADLVRENDLAVELYRMIVDYMNERIQEISWMMLILVVGALIFVSAAFYYLMVRLIKRPLDRIGKKALKISENPSQLGDEIQPPMFQEMQNLTQAFNQMSAALKQQMETLEEQVHKRTEELEAAKEEITYLALHDSLTGLPNRRLFEEQISQGIRFAHRNQVGFSLLMLDLDNFKDINDKNGHIVGDEILVRAARRLRSTVRESDFVGRWGGDEFTAILFNTHQVEKVETVLQKIVAAFDTPIEMQGRQFGIVLSIGVARYPEDGEDPITLMRKADHALYYAKKKAGNTWVIYHPGLEQGEIST